MKAIFELQSALKATDFAVRLSNSNLAAVTGAVYLDSTSEHLYKLDDN